MIHTSANEKHIIKVGLNKIHKTENIRISCSVNFQQLAFSRLKHSPPFNKTLSLFLCLIITLQSYTTAVLYIFYVHSEDNTLWNTRMFSTQPKMISLKHVVHIYSQIIFDVLASLFYFVRMVFNPTKGTAKGKGTPQTCRIKAHWSCSGCLKWSISYQETQSLGHLMHVFNFWLIFIFLWLI